MCCGRRERRPVCGVLQVVPIAAAHGRLRPAAAGSGANSKLADDRHAAVSARVHACCSRIQIRSRGPPHLGGGCCHEALRHEARVVIKEQRQAALHAHRHVLLHAAGAASRCHGGAARGALGARRCANAGGGERKCAMRRALLAACCCAAGPADRVTPPPCRHQPCCPGCPPVTLARAVSPVWRAGCLRFECDLGVAPAF